MKTRSCWRSWLFYRLNTLLSLCGWRSNLMSQWSWTREPRRADRSPHCWGSCFQAWQAIYRAGARRTAMSYSSTSLESLSQWGLQPRNSMTTLFNIGVGQFWINQPGALGSLQPRVWAGSTCWLLCGQSLACTQCRTKWSRGCFSASPTPFPLVLGFTSWWAVQILLWRQTPHFVSLINCGSHVTVEEAHGRLGDSCTLSGESANTFCKGPQLRKINPPTHRMHR